jgi:hypothetical protein
MPRPRGHVELQKDLAASADFWAQGARRERRG